MQTVQKATIADPEQAIARSLLPYRALFRVVFIFHHIAVIVVAENIDLEDPKIPELTILQNYGSRYLTNWNFMMQFIYLNLALLCDFLESMQWNSGTVAGKLASIRAFFFSSLVFPFTLNVTTLFWGIYFLDRELIFPKELDRFVPSWMNHSFHTVILVVVLLDLALQPGERPNNDLKNKITVYSVFFLYQIVLYFTYVETGYWLYPVYKLFNVPQYFMFNVLVFAFCGLSYELQWPLARWVASFHH